jgi:hypothetical protein
MPIPSFAFSYMIFYVFFLLLLGLILSYGLNIYIGASLNIKAPTFTAWTGTFLDYLFWLGQNLAFLFTFMIANPLSAYAILSWFFTGLTILFATCIILIIRG